MTRKKDSKARLVDEIRTYMRTSPFADYEELKVHTGFARSTINNALQGCGTKILEIRREAVSELLSENRQIRDKLNFYETGQDKNLNKYDLVQKVIALNSKLEAISTGASHE